MRRALVQSNWIANAVPVTVIHCGFTPRFPLCSSRRSSHAAKRSAILAVDSVKRTSESITNMKFIDIGANLLDEMYKGKYNDKEYHAPDLGAVLERSWAAGVEKIIITAGSLSEARAALELAKTHDRLFCTVGCHPTRCGEFDSCEGGAEGYLQGLQEVMREGVAAGKIVAVGECGLDYDRLHFCDAATQRKYFAMQFQLAQQSQLPMFLHLRAAADDFLGIIKEHEGEFVGGVVHSFDGTADELSAILAYDKLSIGINGCSLKTADNLTVAAQVPIERLMLETDCPWCEIKNTHAGKSHVTSSWPNKDKKKATGETMVKGRNEPCTIRQVLEVVAGCRGDGITADALADQVYRNTHQMFFKTLPL